MQHVWTYWVGPRDWLVEVCLNSWKHHLSPANWQIHVLGEESLPDRIVLPAGFTEFGAAFQSDLIRLAVLKEYGGVWMDANILLTDSLDWFITQQSQCPHYSGFQKRGFTFTSLYGGRYRGPAHEYMESWFIYAPRPEDACISKWYALLYDISSHHPDYGSHPCYSVKHQTKDNYFMVYQAYGHLQSNDDEFRKAHAQANLIPAEPHMYLQMVPDILRDMCLVLSARCGHFPRRSDVKLLKMTARFRRLSMWPQSAGQLIFGWLQRPSQIALLLRGVVLLAQAHILEAIFR